MRISYYLYNDDTGRGMQYNSLEKMVASLKRFAKKGYHAEYTSCTKLARDYELFAIISRTNQKKASFTPGWQGVIHMDADWTYYRYHKEIIHCWDE